MWGNVHAERAALVSDLTNQPNLDWTVSSLCEGWDIRDVVAHLAATATLSRMNFAKELVRSGFRPDRVVDRQVHAARQCPPTESLDALRSAIHAKASPPQPTITRVIEIVVHGEDIRRPLHIEHDYITTHIADALRYLARDHRFGAKSLIHGLELRASDAGFTVGQGARVEGPAVSLLLAASGRRAALPELSGPGCQLLRQRIESDLVPRPHLDPE
jgi:uncharacterized protein (TIGR03083 family)